MELPIFFRSWKGDRRESVQFTAADVPSVSGIYCSCNSFSVLVAPLDKVINPRFRSQISVGEHRVPDQLFVGEQLKELSPLLNFIITSIRKGETSTPCEEVEC